MLFPFVSSGLLYAEYNSTGPGADASKRVWWSKQLSPQEAAAWTRESVLRGWDPVSEAVARSPAVARALHRAYRGGPGPGLPAQSHSTSFSAPDVSVKDASPRDHEALTTQIRVGG